MRKIAFLEYIFIFEPGETWSHLYEFEGFLGRALSDIGMEAEIIKAIGGQWGRGVVYIKKREDIAPPTEAGPRGRPKTVQGRIRDMQEKKLRAPAKKAQYKRPAKSVIRGFERVLKKAGGGK